MRMHMHPHKCTSGVGLAIWSLYMLCWLIVSCHIDIVFIFSPLYVYAHHYRTLLSASRGLANYGPVK